MISLSEETVKALPSSACKTLLALSVMADARGKGQTSKMELARRSELHRLTVRRGLAILQEEAHVEITERPRGFFFSLCTYTGYPADSPSVTPPEGESVGNPTDSYPHVEHLGVSSLESGRWSLPDSARVRGWDELLSADEQKRILHGIGKFWRAPRRKRRQYPWWWLELAIRITASKDKVRDRAAFIISILQKWHAWHQPVLMVNGKQCPIKGPNDPNARYADLDSRTNRRRFYNRLAGWIANNYPADGKRAQVRNMVNVLHVTARLVILDLEDRVLTGWRGMIINVLDRANADLASLYGRDHKTYHLQSEDYKPANPQVSIPSAPVSKAVQRPVELPPPASARRRMQTEPIRAVVSDTPAPPRHALTHAWPPIRDGSGAVIWTGAQHQQIAQTRLDRDGRPMSAVIAFQRRFETTLPPADILRDQLAEATYQESSTRSPPESDLAESPETAMADISVQEAHPCQ